MMKPYYILIIKCCVSVFIWAIIIAFPSITNNCYGQSTVNFTPSNLSGDNLSNPTSLDFGPDGRLYVAQHDGTIYAYTIKKTAPNNYEITNTETILQIKNIVNHDDDGTLNTSETSREVTGILVVGTSTNPILYVSSSDFRIGGGGTGGDQNLDTNSGIISKLTWNGSSWTKADIVRGLPRSEENHASNGLQLDEQNNILYLASGGHTNAGSPSNNFAFLTEYALSAAIIKIDLNVIETQFNGSYDIPTLDDPTRANTGPNGADQNDPFGGNDGLNQAKLVINGPVQIHSPGYRNSYDLVITKTPGKAGRMYTIDNGANSGWGGYPKNEGTPNVTNEYVQGEPGSTGPGANDAAVNNLDNLHLVSAPGIPPIYGGHPNPIRANPAGAGLYWYDNGTNIAHFDVKPTIDWPPVPVNLANPVESDFRNPGVNDGALYTWASSTNGLAEYTSVNYFNGALTGDLLAASFDGNIYRIKLNEQGTAVVDVSILAGGFGSQPLDVTAQGDNEVFPGTIWAVTFDENNITVFEPVEPAGIWNEVLYNTSAGTPEARHENGFVELNGKFYLIGGRGIKNVNIFDPVTKIWTTGAPPPIELNHFQAIVYNEEIYAICAFEGSFPDETPVDNIYKYNPQSNTWITGALIPANRRRGSAGVVLYENKFYIVGGIQNGHKDGWVPWLDLFDPETGTWTPLPDAPTSRDHFMATLIDGKIYAAGGRQTHYPDFAANTIANVDVYDIPSGTWTSPTIIPTPRGAAAVANVNDELIIAGGEVSTSETALAVVEAYNPVNNAWETRPDLNIGRHGTQLIYYLGKLYICAGSTSLGGSGENNTMANAIYNTNCTGDINSYILDDDLDGYSNGDETVSGTDPCSAASKPNDADLDGISNLTDTDDDNDGLNDTEDKFALDNSNGLNTHLPVNYPFLNGNPGFGLFGMGFTGLMANNVDWINNYDPDSSNLIMGGAVGIATTPAESGDAATNNQKYAFQFGVNINKNTSPFTIQSKLLGSSFFNGIPASELGTQSQGIYFGTGDQDNYLKFVLHANNGNPGFQILIENSGIVTNQNIFPISNLLSASSIELFMDINPLTGVVQFRYKDNSMENSINIGSSIILTGNLLDVVQNNSALAVGIIASSGNKAPYTASWDYLNVVNTTAPGLTEVIRINSGGGNLQFGSEVWTADQFFTGGSSSTYTTSTAISNTTNDILYQAERYGDINYNIPVPEPGKYTVELHFAEIYFQSESSRIFNINVENGQFALPNVDLYKDYGGAFNATVIKAENLQVNDGILNIDLNPLINNAKISGIAVFKQSENQSPLVVKPPDIILTVNQAWSYQVQASDPDTGAVLTYSAVGLPASLSLNSATGVISGTVTAAAGIYNVSLSVSDQHGLSDSTSFTITVQPAATLTEVIRINSGGGNIQFGNEVWTADQFFTGGSSSTYTTSTAISNTANDILYQSERYGNVSYSIPVPQAGEYTVELHFAEIYFQSAGSRVFNISVENGQFTLPNVDLYKDHGGAFSAVVIKAENLQVNDGILNIVLTSLVNNAKISGIAIYKESDGIPNQPPIANAGPDTIITLPVNSVNLNGSGSDPEDGTNITYSWIQVSGPNTALFNSTATADPTVSNLIAGSYVFSLTVKDQLLVNSVPDQVTVTVNAASGGQQVISFTLINANTEEDIQTILNGANINLTTLPTTNLNIRANTSPATVGSVVFALTGSLVNNKTESSAPYALFGDNSGNYNAWTPQIGSYSLTATPYSGGGGSGTAGSALTINFSIVNQSENQPPAIIKPVDITLTVNQSWNYQVQASDPDAGSVLIYSAVGLPASLSLNSATGVISGTVTADAGIYNVSLNVSDQQGLSDSTSFTITVQPAATLTEVIRINSGGGNIQFGNEVWTADQFFTGGSSSTYTTSTAISNTANDILYQSERYGDISYSIPVPQAGEYTVELHFAEIYFQSAGSRIFNINVENGQFTLPNVDLYKDHGGAFNAAVIKAENLQVNDGILNIDLIPLINNAKISGIAVFKQSAMDAAETVTIASLSSSNLTINKGPKLSNFDSMVLYPNPAQKSFSLKLKINQSGQWKFVLYSIAGEATPLQSYNFEEGIQTVNFDLYPFNLIPGIYHLLITNNLNERKTIKLIIEDKLSTY